MRTLAFYTCSNGYGHFKRVNEIAKLLTQDFDITIFCYRNHLEKFEQYPGIHYQILKYHNIRWDSVLKTGKVNTFLFQHSIEEAKKLLVGFDLVVSDNIISILEPISNGILLSSFFWFDILDRYLGETSVSVLEREILHKRQPPILTNKYLEIGEVENYKHKVGYGFGESQNKFVYLNTERIYGLYPSLDYSHKYNEYIDKLPNVTFDTEKSKTSTIAARPGVGTITYCVENNLPLLALYDENDSYEIIELANKVEKLGIGIKQNINTPLNVDRLSELRNNSMYESTNLEHEGYLNIADFIKKYKL